MKPEIKAEWVAALRSGEYEQGYHVLQNEEGRYCCLGVLCEIAVKHGVIAEPTQVSDGAWNYDACDATPSTKVGEWAGFEWKTYDDDIDPDGDGGYQVTNPQVMVEGSFGRISRDLAALNDSGNYDFNAIADLIEAQL